MNEWYVLRTKPQKEKLVERVVAQVTNGDLKTYLPLLPPKRGKQPRPLFPSYLFFQLEPTSQYWVYISWAWGVGYVLHDKEGYLPVPPDLVAEISQREQQAWERKHRLDANPLALGEPVEILAGPFKGLHAVFDGTLNDQQRVNVLLTVIGNTMRLELEAVALDRPK